MQKNKILLCVSGGIAAYKAIDLASTLTKSGYEVRSILTEGAGKFVTPLNFAAITRNAVHSSMFSDADPIPHITLADWADLVVVAPATANVMAKAVYGFADDLLGATLLAHNKPVLFVPAMNVKMFEANATQRNMEQLRQDGNYILEPETGMLACGYVGKGKYPDNREVVHAIATYLNHSRDLTGKKVLVTAGATLETIDPMRYISNRSSGKMGLAIARALALRGAEVTLVHANVRQPLPHYLHELVECESAAEMFSAVMDRYAGMDWIIKCAAVADYTPKISSDSKIAKQAELSLGLTATKDILATLGKEKKAGQLLIGFAAQTEDLIGKAVAKLKNKNLDAVCANHISNAGKDNNELTVIGKFADKQPLDGHPGLGFATLSGDKFGIAHELIDMIKELCAKS